LAIMIIMRSIFFSFVFWLFLLILLIPCLNHLGQHIIIWLGLVSTLLHDYS
jgi:hypothetical protein